MNTQATRFLSTLAAIICFSGLTLAQARAGEPWTDKQLKDPAVLAATITDPKAPKPVILNIGPVQQIKGAIAIGPVNTPENLEKLRTAAHQAPQG